MEKMVNLLRRIIITSVLLLFLTLFANISHAEDVLNKFNANTEKSEYQLNESAAYFDLLLKPGQKTKLKVLVENNSDETINIKASVNQAVTNQNGVVEYSGRQKNKSKTAPYNIEDIVKLSDADFKLKKGEKKELILDVSMPDKEFSGVLAGALYLIEVPEGESETMIRNILSREIAVLLQNDDAPVEPELVFNKAEALPNNGRNAIEILMENVSSTYIKDATITYDISRDGKEFLKDKKEQVKIAPNSDFPFIISLAGTAIEAGNYVAEVTVKTSDNEWKEELAFKVDKEKSKELNDNDLTGIKKPEFPWSTALLLLVLVAFIGLAFYLISNNKKLKNEMKKSKRKSSKSRKSKSSSSSKATKSGDSKQTKSKKRRIK